jgi:thiamine biosynthesis protein ThiI
MRHVIAHYHEIALKGKNRPFFINKLLDNLRYATKGTGVDNAKDQGGRVILSLASDAREDLVKDRVSKVFGIANFAFGYRTSNDVEVLKEAVLRHIKDKAFKSFRVSTKRGYKEYPLTSMDVDRIVGAHIKGATGAKVDLTHPELTVFIEVLSKEAFFYTEKFQGQGGLPVGTGGKVACLLSGGIDSPVAAYRMMKRGCSVLFVHFHSYPYLSKMSQEKVGDIAEILNQYQRSSKLFLIPFGDIQKEIVLHTPARYRVVLYRRMMVRITEAIAKREKALALVTGESLGQVASQTLENIRTIENAVTLPVLRPLIGMDKGEIIGQARAIGTYDISIIPDQDCCQLFIPKNPAVRTTIEEIERVEKALDIPGLISMGLAH